MAQSCRKAHPEFRFAPSTLREVNHRVNSYKSSAKTLLTSQRRLMHRGNRPTEPEACFGNIKFNHGSKRFHLNSRRKTKVEWGLVSLAHNLRKYVAYKTESMHKQAQSMVLVTEKSPLGERGWRGRFKCLSERSGRTSRRRRRWRVAPPSGPVAQRLRRSGFLST